METMGAQRDLENCYSPVQHQWHRATNFRYEDTIVTQCQRRQARLCILQWHWRSNDQRAWKVRSILFDSPQCSLVSRRLLNLDVGQWCHLNCALWSSEVYETVSGALMSVEQAFKRSTHTDCVICKKKGASLGCFYQRCPNTYHFPCAVEHGCVFYKNKVRPSIVLDSPSTFRGVRFQTIMCPVHASRATITDQILEDKSVFRKVWINRDEVKQIQE